MLNAIAAVGFAAWAGILLRWSLDTRECVGDRMIYSVVGVLCCGVAIVALSRLI